MSVFTEKTIVLTGAAGGIGAALTANFLAGGALVYALDVNEESLKTLELKAKKLGQPLKTILADVSSLESMRAAIKEILSAGKPINYWINNAGISGLGDFMERSHEDFERTIRINLGGVAIGTRLALEHMEHEGRGTIVNVASVAGHISAPYLTAYSASKHAVVGFTRALKQELKLKDSPVKLVMICPGFVDTQMIARGTKEGFPEWLSFLLSTPDKVAKEILTALAKGQAEIYPTLNGKAMMKMNRLFPGITTHSSRVLLSKSVKDFILLRKQPP